LRLRLEEETERTHHEKHEAISLLSLECERRNSVFSGMIQVSAALIPALKKIFLLASSEYYSGAR